VNPPAPVACPIGGRYSFIQIGPKEEQYVTRIRGITERPRHLIDCLDYVSEFKSCDINPKKILVDAEYCATLDHTGKPIGEYGKCARFMQSLFHVLAYQFSFQQVSLVDYDQSLFHGTD